MEIENLIKHYIRDETSIKKRCVCDNRVDALKRLNNRTIKKCALELSVGGMQKILKGFCTQIASQVDKLLLYLKNWKFKSPVFYGCGSCN